VAAVLAAALGVSVSGGMVAAAAAWSDSGPARVASVHHHGRGHGRGGATGGATTITQPATTTVVSTVTTTTTTATSTTTTKTSTGKSAAAPKPKPKPKPVNRLSATLASTALFPERQLGLWTSLPSALTAGQVHVTENGQPVSGVSLEPLSGAGSKDFGVVVVLDESSSLSLNTRMLELATASAIAQKRTGQQAFGLVTFSSYPTVMLPLTTKTSLIAAGLETNPLLAPGSSVVPALAMAYGELHRAGMATGAVIVVTAGKNLADPAQEAAASLAGRKLGYQTFSTDVLAAPPSGKSSAPKSGDSGDDDAAQEAALGEQLASAADIWTKLSAGYLLSYRSAAKPGDSVTVSVSADGVVGAPTFGYTATHAAPVPAPPVPPLSQLPALTGQPSFAEFVPAAAPVARGRSGSSFWSSPASLVVVSFLCAVLLAGALWLMVGGVGKSALETRVSSFIPGSEPEEDPVALALAENPGVPPFLARRRWWPGFALKVDVARFRRSPVALVKLAVSGSLVALVLLTMIWGTAAGLFLGLPLGPFVLWVLLRRGVRKSQARFQDQLPSALQDMAGAVRGGRSLAGALLAVTDGASEPILGEFERLIADEQLGRPLEDSLQTVGQRMKSEDMQQVALVARLHRRSGSSVAEALGHVADGARERAELMRELKSLTGQARLSSRILTALPVVLFFAMSLMEPGYMRPITSTTGGIVVLVMCGFMVLLGWLAMRRIVDVEV
jgi:tight adherence protein B